MKPHIRRKCSNLTSNSSNKFNSSCFDLELRQCNELNSTEIKPFLGSPSHMKAGRSVLVDSGLLRAADLFLFFFQPFIPFETFLVSTLALETPHVTHAPPLSFCSSLMPSTLPCGPALVPQQSSAVRPWVLLSFVLAVLIEGALSSFRKVNPSPVSRSRLWLFISSDSYFVLAPGQANCGNISFVRLPLEMLHAPSFIQRKCSKLAKFFADKKLIYRIHHHTHASKALWILFVTTGLTNDSYT